MSKPIADMTPEELGRELAEGLGWEPFRRGYFVSHLSEAILAEEIATTWEGAGAVLEALAAKPRVWTPCLDMTPMGWRVEVMAYKGGYTSIHPHAPLAIARAAVAALRGEKP